MDNNYFEFDGGIYTQTLGTAIGTKFAPALGNVFMSELECRMLGEYHLNPMVWWRFLDDVFLIWLYGEEILLEFLEYVNTYHKTIKYTWDWSMEKLSYLDVLISIKDNKIRTDIYCKSTDTPQYLDSILCHPSHVKKQIPYGQALRVRRICNSDEIFDKILKELKCYFVKRGFKEGMSVNQFRKAKAKK